MTLFPPVIRRPGSTPPLVDKRFLYMPPTLSMKRGDSILPLQASLGGALRHFANALPYI